MTKYQAREFRLGEYWLSKTAKSQAWQRTHYCTKTRQTKRSSLGTADFDQAQIALTEWFIRNATGGKRPSDQVLLDEVLMAYYDQHASKVRAASRIKYQLRHVQAFFAGMTVSAACKKQTMGLFTLKMREYGLKESYINNILSVIRAAVYRAHDNELLSDKPVIKAIKEALGEPKGRPLEVEEIQALLREAKGHVWLMMVLALGTGARPEALLELTWEQIDLRAGVIKLNADGRVQTRKRRPVVRVPPTLAKVLKAEQRCSGNVILYRGHPYRRYHEAWKKAKLAAGLTGTVTPYSMRHTVARWCRSEGVSGWEVAEQLGHSGGSRLSITERYTGHDPAYLNHACTAIEKLLALALRGSSDNFSNDNDRIEETWNTCTRWSA